MIPREALTQFFGWYTAINIGMYVISAATVVGMRRFITRHDTRWFGFSQKQLMRVSLNWLAAYKLGIVLFAMVPWLALSLMR
jgi:hypothetical protein